jgi:uncharacterized protein YdeI (YjbR/CyaY-like superfamily)
MPTPTSESINGVPTLYANSVQSWRDWLEANGRREQSIWLVVYNLHSEVPGVHFQEAIEHGLCYGLRSAPRPRHPSS